MCITAARSPPRSDPANRQVLLEGFQAFMPERSSYYLAAVYSAAGVLAAALAADLFIRARKRFRSKRAGN